MGDIGNGGVTWNAGPWTAGARQATWRAHALAEDNSVPRQTARSAVAPGLRIGKTAELSLDVFNLFSRRANDIQCRPHASRSALPGSHRLPTA